ISFSIDRGTVKATEYGRNPRESDLLKRLEVAAFLWFGRRVKSSMIGLKGSTLRGRPTHHTAWDRG
ncbi:MAG: hypothetical protein ACXU9K_10760, partial [Thermodesulfobacteriota bacterium]